MTTRARRAAACAGSVALSAIVPTWLYIAGLLLGTDPAAAFPAALATVAAFYLPAAILVAWLERRLALNWSAPLLFLTLSTVLFAAAFAYCAFPRLPNCAGTAAAWLIASGPAVGLGLHGIVYVLVRAKQGADE